MARAATALGVYSAIALAIMTVVRSAFVGFPAGTLEAVSMTAAGGFIAGFVTRFAFSSFRRLGGFGAILTGCMGTLAYMLTMAAVFGPLSSIDTLFFALSGVYGVAIGWFIVMPIQKRATLAEASPPPPPAA